MNICRAFKQRRRATRTGLRFVARAMGAHHMKLFRFERGDESQLDELQRAELARVLGEIEQLRAALAPYDLKFSTYAGLARALAELRRGELVIRAGASER